MQNMVNDSDLKASRVKEWFFLILAIVLEVSGVAMLNAIPLWLNPFCEDGFLIIMGFSVEPKYISKMVLLVMIIASYYSMSFALRKIALGVAYSVWEIVGMIGILLISFLFFPPDLTIQQYIGIAVGCIGIICVILGEEH